MKTLTTQLPSSRRLSWILLPALLVLLLGFCAFPSSGQTWTVGTGTSMYAQTGTPVSPLGYFYPNVRVNYLYDTASLRAAGMPVGTPTTIHQIAFNVGALQSAIGSRNFEVKIGGTTVTTLPTGGFLSGSGGYPVYYTSAGGFNPTLGWNTINLSSAFPWNGTDNIVIEICWYDGTTATGSGQAGVYYHTTTGGVKSTYAYGTGTGAYCGTPLPPTSTTANTTNRPNIRFSHLLPCTGTPVAFTTTPSGTVTSLCPGSTATIAAQNYTNALSTKFQWWTSSTPTGPWILARGDSASDRYTTPPMIANTYYRLTITCLNSGDSVVSSVVGFTFSAGFPIYASLPYFESFEAWGNGCATSDKVSSNNWTNTPNTGASSWRREDQGASASWTTNTAVPPKAIDGSHFARWHGYTALPGNGGSGVLQLYVNTSATAGNKDLSFYYYFEYGTPSATLPIDSIVVDYSTDGGVTFNDFGPPVQGKIGYPFGPQRTWNLVTIPNIPVSSPTTVFRFRAKRGTNTTYIDDIYIDAVRIDPPCGGKPVAGKVDSVIACKGKLFKLKLKGNVPAAGLTYLWQYMPAGSSVWSPLPGGNIASPSYSMTVNTAFRVIVTCTNTTPNVSDTTPAYNATLAPFYYCYCSPVFVNPTLPILGYSEVGNVTIITQPAAVTLLNNGIATPTLNNPTATLVGYEDFRLTIPPPVLVRDSTYRISISQISANTTWAGSNGVAWLDINRNGVFEASEMIINRSIASSSSPTVSGLFTIGSIAPVGLTGLRVSTFYSTPIDPCTLPFYGQYEDYLVRIEYQPCTGPVTPGVAWASDTAICPGYTIDLYDTSYEHTRTNILRMWEVSTNGGASYSAIPGSAQKDTMKNVMVTATSYYRLRVICGVTNDTTYSNPVFVRTPEPVRCYPTSWAGPGGDSDSSDIGSFIIHDFINPGPGVPAGPHLLNPMAHQRRTDFTLMPPIPLSADSTYRLAIFHTMPRAFHADALISVFIDFNNDGDYDLNVPPPPFISELVYQGLSTASNFFLDTFVKMPNAVIPNKLTGMRVVINNDTNPFGPGNTGSGLFTSGEVEDYIVIFNRTSLSTGTNGLLQNLALYPNPTEGRFTVLSDATRAVSHMDVVISTITGQQVMSHSFDNVGTHFTTSLDLSTQAKGIYFVEIRADGDKITKKLIVR